MDSHQELFNLSQALSEAGAFGDASGVAEPIDAVVEAAQEAKRAFSGSWLGYHARVYYAEFAPPPPGAHFSQEWGIEDRLGGHGTTGDWVECDARDVKAYILARAGKPKLDAARAAEVKAKKAFDRAKSEMLSIFETERSAAQDTFLEKLQQQLEELEVMTPADVADAWRPKGQIMTRDMIAMGQGQMVPPHVEAHADVVSLRHTFAICLEASDIASKAASHLERKGKKAMKAARVGTNVFIGHGRSSAWRELKDFVQDRLKLPWDEFNRVPVAGVTNIARLSEMLDSAAIAFLVLTAEDETKDGKVRARENVVHEAGLFQGRLGFTKAIVLLEEGCEEFSNIHGLGQIRFPKGKIASAFEEVRRVVERELEDKE